MEEKNNALREAKAESERVESATPAEGQEDETVKPASFSIAGRKRPAIREIKDKKRFGLPLQFRFEGLQPGAWRVSMARRGWSPTTPPALQEQCISSVSRPSTPWVSARGRHPRCPHGPPQVSPSSQGPSES